jgi:hypothetical protein
MKHELRMTRVFFIIVAWKTIIEGNANIILYP